MAEGRPATASLSIFAGILLVAVSVNHAWLYNPSPMAIGVLIETDVKVAVLIVTLLLGIVWCHLPPRFAGALISVVGAGLTVLGAISIIYASFQRETVAPTIYGYLTVSGAVLLLVGGLVTMVKHPSIGRRIPDFIRGQVSRSHSSTRTTTDRVEQIGPGALVIGGFVLIGVGFAFGVGGRNYHPLGEDPVVLWTDIHWTIALVGVMILLTWPELSDRFQTPGYVAAGMFLMALLAHVVLYIPFHHLGASTRWFGYFVFVGAVLVSLSGISTTLQRRSQWPGPG